MSTRTRHTLTRPLGIRVTLVIQILLGCSAVGGGALFIFAPDGSLMHMPVSLLQNGPFRDFLIPGIFLALVLGCGELMASWSLFSYPQRRPAKSHLNTGWLSWAWHSSLALSLLSILWIQIQSAIIGVVWLQAVVVVLHVLVIFLLSLGSSLKYCGAEQ